MFCDNPKCRFNIREEEPDKIMSWEGPTRMVVESVLTKGGTRLCSRCRSAIKYFLKRHEAL